MKSPPVARRQESSVHIPKAGKQLQFVPIVDIVGLYQQSYPVNHGKNQADNKLEYKVKTFQVELCSQMNQGKRTGCVGS